jgi:RNA polymerase primary sigma factor
VWSTPPAYRAADTDAYLDAVEEALPRLVNARHRRILEMRFGLSGNLPCTLKEVAQAFGISLQRVSVIEKDAITELRKDPALFDLMQ